MTGTTTIDPPVARTTSPGDDFLDAWEAFLQALAAVARVRATSEREFVDLLLDRILPAMGDAGLRDETASALQAMEQVPNERVLLDVLTREMWFYVWAYRDADNELPQRVPRYYQVPMREVQRDPQSDEAVEDAATVIGSIEKFLDKMPGPLKRFLHALLEVLKLTHGAV